MSCRYEVILNPYSAVHNSLSERQTVHSLLDHSSYNVGCMLIIVWHPFFQHGKEDIAMQLLFQFLTSKSKQKRSKDSSNNVGWYVKRLKHHLSSFIARSAVWSCSNISSDIFERFSLSNIDVKGCQLIPAMLDPTLRDEWSNNEWIVWPRLKKGYT